MSSKLSVRDIIDCNRAVGLDINVIKAVIEVESAGRGFNPDGTPVTLFEGHIFHKLTNAKYTNSKNRDISYPRWTKKYYGKSWQQEKDRFERAVKLDREAALKSASWGLFQIMGFNHKLCGFSELQDFINAMYKSEKKHLEVFFEFIVNSGYVQSLWDKDWVKFARRYNGIGQVNYYADKLEKAYDRLVAAT